LRAHFINHRGLIVNHFWKIIKGAAHKHGCGVGGQHPTTTTTTSATTAA
jgi:hypothetical protein